MNRPLVSSRRAFLAGVATGAIALGTACTPSPPETPPPGRRTKESTIFGLSLSIQSRYRPFDVVAPEFLAVDEEAGDGTGIVVSDNSPPAPYAALELEVRGSEAAVVLLGLATADGGHLLATFDRARRRVGIEVRRGGRSRLLRQRKVELPESLRLGFVLCESQVTVVADTGTGWKPLLTERDRVAAAVDLRVPETLATFRYAWGARSRNGSAQLGAVRAGLFGMTGIRDPHLVQYSDGRPYARDGKVYLTATCAGMGSFRQAHWGVFALDLADPTRLQPVAKLFSSRDGLVLGDHAGQLVRDEDADRWIVATSSWGDFSFTGVHVRHTSTTDDILSGVHVLETERVPLPTSKSSWDPGLTKIDGAWHVAFVESASQKPFEFHPVLAVATIGSEWTDGLQVVGAATRLHRCEGPIISKVDGKWWLVASDGEHRDYPVFDMQMHRVGRLDAPYLTNIPHPQLLQLLDGSYLMVTFDGTPYGEAVLGYGGHGDVILMRGG